MSQKTLRALKRLCYDTSPGDPVAAERRYRSLKANWEATPRSERGDLMKTLGKARDVIVKRLAASAEAKTAAAASATQSAATPDTASR